MRRRKCDKAIDRHGRVFSKQFVHSLLAHVDEVGSDPNFWYQLRSDRVPWPAETDNGHRCPRSSGAELIRAVVVYDLAVTNPFLSFRDCSFLTRQDHSLNHDSVDCFLKQRIMGMKQELTTCSSQLPFTAPRFTDILLRRVVAEKSAFGLGGVCAAAFDGYRAASFNVSLVPVSFGHLPPSGNPIPVYLPQIYEAVGCSRARHREHEHEEGNDKSNQSWSGPGA